ncbi:MAG TPA: hypothetical protein VEL47_00085 [Myxococcota bacterium]|nr:hypothetical protein [Myxococcota bacterium]
MTSRIIKPLISLASLLLLPTFVWAEPIVVLYRPGFPDTTAPAQVLEKNLDGRMVSCLDETALKEIAEKGGYKELITFDTFLEPEKIAVLKDKLASLDPSVKLSIYVKKGDSAYEAVKCDEKKTVDFKDGSYLIPAMEKTKMAITEGAKLLDNGLSHRPSADGKAMRELYSTRECSKDTLFQIIEADVQQLQKLLESGRNFVEKLMSQTTLLVKTASYETLTENGLRIGFQLAATGISALGPAIIDSGKADIAIILTASDPFKGEHRYSIRNSDQYNARKIYEFIKSKTYVIRGGGDDVAAGLTCKATPQEIIGVFRTMATADITR